MDTPSIAMTATASSTVKTKSTQSKDVLGWLCVKISEKGVNTERVIVYCQSRKHAVSSSPCLCSCR